MSGNVRLGLAVACFCAVAATLVWHPEWVGRAAVALMPLAIFAAAILAGPPKGGKTQWVTAAMLGAYWGGAIVASESVAAAVVWGIAYGTGCALVAVEHYELTKK